MPSWCGTGAVLCALASLSVSEFCICFWKPAVRSAQNQVSSSALCSPCQPAKSKQLGVHTVFPCTALMPATFTFLSDSASKRPAQSQQKACHRPCTGAKTTTKHQTPGSLDPRIEHKACCSGTLRVVHTTVAVDPDRGCGGHRRRCSKLCR